jgi:methylphosphotriester-DNA--protein-cysteine methyltransferase
MNLKMKKKFQFKESQNRLPVITKLICCLIPVFIISCVSKPPQEMPAKVITAPAIAPADLSAANQPLITPPEEATVKSSRVYDVSPAPTKPVSDNKPELKRRTTISSTDTDDAVQISDELKPAAIVYRGNTSTKVFHKKGCKAFRCKQCTATFASRNEAIKAGYKPCGKCKPLEDPPPAKTEIPDSPKKIKKQQADNSAKSKSVASVYRGNTSTKIFHKKGCKAFRCKQCTATFASRDEAIKAGYRPCGKCKP